MMRMMRMMRMMMMMMMLDSVVDDDLRVSQQAH